jgi:hypothetical protein
LTIVWNLLGIRNGRRPEEAVVPGEDRVAIFVNAPEIFEAGVRAPAIQARDLHGIVTGLIAYIQLRIKGAVESAPSLAAIIPRAFDHAAVFGKGKASRVKQNKHSGDFSGKFDHLLLLKTSGL